MSAAEIIAVIQAVTGAGIILASLVISRKIADSSATKWIYVWLFMSLLLAVQILFVVLISLHIDYSQNIFTGSVFLLSAGFIYTAVTFIKSNARRLRQEITLKKSRDRKLKMAVTYDELTGLYNRGAFMTIMKNHVKIANRQKKGIVLMYAHIDNIQTIKDTMGYQESDLMIVEAARLLKKTFRKSDIVSRVSDDEFAVFLFSATEGHVREITESFRKKLERYNSKKQHKYKLSLNFGISHFDPEYNDSINSALAQAYDLMVESRNKGQEAQPHSTPNTHP